jgi:hypothetical protein
MSEGLNVELLLKVKEAILANPTKFSMSSWCSHPFIFAFISSCDTVACIAGWTVALSGERLGVTDTIASKARRLLNLSVDEKEYPFSLFYTHNWPADLKVLAQEDEAKAAGIAIDRFIEGCGK